MPFSVYKLKFNVYAAHTNFADRAPKGHYHTFLLTLYLKVETEEYDAVKNLAVTEKQIDRWLDSFRNRDLRQTELFRDRDTSVETLGNVFFKELIEYFNFHETQLELIRLDISDNPIRNYSVSKRPLDKDVNEIPHYPYDALLNEKQANRDETTENRGGDSVKAENESAAPETISNALVEIREPMKSEAESGSSLTSGSKGKKAIRLIAAILLLIAASVATVHFVELSGVYPRGFDVMYHMYRSASLLESIQNGDWYPLYDKLLYNGVQVMRYWAPIPVYVLTLCSMIANNLMNGYLLYLGFVFFLGGSGWLLFGWKHDRLILAAALGTIWFFIPDNLRVFFGSGNLPRGLIAALLPWLLFFILEFIETRKLRNAIAVTALVSVMALCHLGEAGIIVLCLVLFLIIYALIHKKAAGPLWIMPGIGLSFLLIGIWLYPSLQGGLLSMGEDNLQAMKSSFSNGWKSLNPFERYHDIGLLYFGLVLFVICLLGILLANKKTKPGFITGLVIYFGTTVSFYPVISNMPFGHLFWMERFVTFAMAAVLASVFLWKELKKWIVFLLCLLIALDCIPSLGYIYVPEQQRISDPVQAQEEYAQKSGLTKLKEETEQRAAVMDLSSYGSFVPYYLAGSEPKTFGTFGAAWQSAKTARNIVQLNTAFSSGYYDYMFDRCLELGNDTVLIRTFLLKNGKDDVGEVTAAGTKLGYELTYRDKNILLFSRETEGNFGVKTAYSAIAIGDSARDIALRYPVFKETTDGNLNHYTYENLKDYNVIYLSGFTYDDEEKAEKLLKKLGEKGVRIYVDMNRVPVDQTTKTAQFLGIKAQEASFQESMPSLKYRGKEFTPYPFDNPLEDEKSKWNTVYLTGLENEIGYSIFENKKIAFYGTGRQENIYFIGFNVPYYVLTRFDKGLATMLDDMLGIQGGTLPVRTLVPIRVQYSDEAITVRTEEDGVNTTLAYHDIFRSDQKIYEDNNLLVVDRGLTEIGLEYPYFEEGILMSVSGFVLLALYLVLLRRYNRKREEKEVAV